MNKNQPVVLVIDDESAIRDMIKFALEQAGMRVQSAANAHQALLAVSERRPDMILMDWMMPGVSGIELTRRLRKDSFSKDIPIIMLTARVTEDDKVAGLEAGTDDFVIKPFSPRELIARIRAVLRRSSPLDASGQLTLGKLTLDTIARRIMHNSVEIQMGPTEYRLLEFFMTHAGRSYSRTQLLDHVWGTNAYLEERTVDVHIRRLRKALEPFGSSHYLQTIRGHGYRFLIEQLPFPVSRVLFPPHEDRLDPGPLRRMPVRNWKFHIGRLILIAGIILALGWLAGYPGKALALALAAYTGWHVVNGWRLFRWLQGSENAIPESFGLWADIFDTINSLAQRNRMQQEQYRAIIGEFHSLTDAFPDATLVIDENDQITWFNNAASSLLGLKLPEDLGQAVTNLLRGPDFADWLAIQGEVKSRLEMPSPRSDTTWLTVSAVSFRDKQRLIILGDISDVHQVEQIRRDFVENISHELRTPLTVLLGYLELLRQDPPDEMSNALERMQDQALQMQSMLNDLLELSRLQSDEIRKDEEIVNIPTILTRLKEQAEELSRGKHELVFDVDASLYLSGIAPDIESALRNLITNALKYTPPGGTVSVNWSDTPEGPLLTVSDSGIGIPKREIPRLTERFYRVGSDRARQSGGTGLGLSIVKHVLNAHHASLLIHSELGEGSEFICTFPPERKRSKPDS